MGKYILKRTLNSILTVVIVFVAVFMLLRLMQKKRMASTLNARCVTSFLQIVNDCISASGIDVDNTLLSALTDYVYPCHFTVKILDVYHNKLRKTKPRV